MAASTDKNSSTGLPHSEPLRHECEREEV